MQMNDKVFIYSKNRKSSPTLQSSELSVCKWCVNNLILDILKIPQTLINIHHLDLPRKKGANWGLKINQLFSIHGMLSVLVCICGVSVCVFVCMFLCGWEGRTMWANLKLSNFLSIALTFHLFIHLIFKHILSSI